jgi:nucleoside-diphosphate-sugar epimerase
MVSLFLTGGSGLIGSRLLQRLDPARYDAIFCLRRGGLPASAALGLPANVVHVRGDLSDPNVYAPYLARCETVIHLAAQTGKARPSEFAAVNVRGTMSLIDACERAGVANLLFASSIAAKYGQNRRYPYARSKLLAEAAVRKSRLRYTIVRPTLVLAPEARNWQALARLARFPRPLVFGDGETMIQPIHLDDLVRCVSFVVEQRRFDNETLELGGPEPIRFGQLMQRIHRAYRGVEHETACIPIRPVMAAIGVLEKPLFPLLPFSVGQLASFVEDGTIEENDVYRQCVGQMRTIDEAIALVIRREGGADAA